MFEGLKGNDNVKELLHRLVGNNRVPQSLLFCGVSGVGKKQFALELARSFLCNEKEAGLPCGSCAACKRAVSFTLPDSGKKEDYEAVNFSEHPDVGLVIPNKNTIYIDAVRNLVEEANYRPFEGRARVFIIDEAEKLSLTQKAAANALLKTLEEPPDTTYIILVTSNPSAVPQTIHSRCQKVRFSGVSDREIQDILTTGSGISTGDARLIARVSKGSVADACAMNLEDYRETRSGFLEVLNSAVSGKGAARMLRISEAIAVTKEPGEFLRSLEVFESLIRDILLIKRAAHEQIVNTDIARELGDFSDALDPERILGWIDQIESLKSNLRFNINKKIGADALFVKMAGH